MCTHAQVAHTLSEGRNHLPRTGLNLGYQTFVIQSGTLEENQGRSDGRDTATNLMVMGGRKSSFGNGRRLLGRLGEVNLELSLDGGIERIKEKNTTHYMHEARRLLTVGGDSGVITGTRAYSKRLSGSFRKKPFKRFRNFSIPGPAT